MSNTPNQNLPETANGSSDTIAKLNAANTNEIAEKNRPNNPPASLSNSQRFVNKVMKTFAEETHINLNLSESQKRLIQGYFIMIDRALKIADESRIRKNAKNSNHNYDNEIPYDWNHINIVDLALDVVHYAKMGLDMQEKNHLFPIPYANRKTGGYDISFTVGYSGIQYIAEKYAITPPKSVTVEVVYSTDTFKPLKKCKDNPIEGYEFEITQPFDRGEIVGGFGYIEYDEPSKNELVIMTKADIKKRAGKNASAEFWGTEMTGKQIPVWENGKQVYVDSEGWQDEMVRKTLIRETYSGKHIPRDPQKIDDHYLYLREREVVYAQAEINSTAYENENTIPIDVPTAQNQPQIVANDSNVIDVSETEIAPKTQPASSTIDGISDPDF